MTLLDILDPEILTEVNAHVIDGWTIVRISFCRGYLPVGRGYVTYDENSSGDLTASIYVPNRRSAQKSNRYHAVIRMVKPSDLPF